MSEISVCRRCNAAMATTNLMTPAIAAFRGVLGRYPTEAEVCHPAICREHGQSRLVPRFPLDAVLRAVRAYDRREAALERFVATFHRDMEEIFETRNGRWA